MERRRLVGLLQSSGELGAEVTDLGTFGGDPQSAPYNKRSNETFGGTRGHIFSVKCVEVKNNLLYTGSLDETVREWDIERCQCLREFEIEAMMYGMCLYHDWVFTSSVGDRSKAARMWDMSTGEEVKRFIGHAGDVLDVAVDDAGQYLYTVSGFPDCCIKQWNVRSGKCVRTIGNPAMLEQQSKVLNGHTDDIKSVLAFGNRLITVSGDRTVKEWNLQTGLCERTFDGHTDKVNDICYYEGNLFTASADGTAVLLWAFPNKGYDLMLSPTSGMADPYGRDSPLGSGPTL